MAFIEGWPHLRGGLYEGFHCNGLTIPFLLSKSFFDKGNHNIIIAQEDKNIIT